MHSVSKTVLLIGVHSLEGTFWQFCTSISSGTVVGTWVQTLFVTLNRINQNKKLVIIWKKMKDKLKKIASYSLALGSTISISIS